MFSDAYERKLGSRIFPGSLNLALDSDFDWHAPSIRSAMVRFDRSEMGSERDVPLVPSVLSSLEDQAAFLWTTTTAARDRLDPWVIEIIAEVGLRQKFDLSDGDTVEVAIL